MKTKTKPLNDRQRRFAELIVAGETATSAYAKSFPRCKSKVTARTQGSKLLTLSNIQNFIGSLRSEVQQAVKSDIIAEKKEALEFLTKVLRTPIGEIDEQSPLAQSYEYYTMPGDDERTMHKLKVPDKLRAIERMAKMLGWDTAEKLEHDVGDTLMAFMRSVRRKEIHE